MQKGFCVWLTGLPCSGKTTIAQELIGMVQNRGRQVTLLDGDGVRPWLSNELGFSRDDRTTNITRVGRIAQMLTSHGAAVICSLVSPYREAREHVRRMVGGDFVEVWVHADPLLCAARDVKGMWKEAKSGKRRHFTGFDDPYEPPARAELVINTSNETPQQSGQRVLELLLARGYLDGKAGRSQKHETVAAL